MKVTAIFTMDKDGRQALTLTGTSPEQNKALMAFLPSSGGFELERGGAVIKLRGRDEMLRIAKLGAKASEEQTKKLDAHLFDVARKAKAEEEERAEKRKKREEERKAILAAEELERRQERAVKAGKTKPPAWKGHVQMAEVEAPPPGVDVRRFDTSDSEEEE